MSSVAPLPRAVLCAIWASLLLLSAAVTGHATTGLADSLRKLETMPSDYVDRSLAPHPRSARPAPHSAELLTMYSGFQFDLPRMARAPQNPPEMASVSDSSAQLRQALARYAPYLVALLRGYGWQTRPMLVRSSRAGEVDTSAARPADFDAVLVAAIPPETTGVAGPDGEILVDPACAWCEFGYVPASWQGGIGVLLDHGRLVWRRIPFAPVDAHRITHWVEIELDGIERMGRPPLPGGFRDPDTTGTWPSLAHRVRERWIWYGEARRLSPQGPKRNWHVDIPAFSFNHPGIMRGDGLTGGMCWRPWQPGHYRVPDVGMCTDSLLRHVGIEPRPGAQGGKQVLTLPYPVVVTDTVMIRLPGDWQMVSLPSPLLLRRPHFLYETECVLADSCYMRTTSLSIDSTRLPEDVPGDWEQVFASIRAVERTRPEVVPH